MENNNLAHALFGKLMFYTYNAFYVHNRRMRRKCFWWILLIGFWTSISGPAGGWLKFDWPTRQKICAGIARGLAFLHEESTLKIVRRDIKYTNILLDGDLNPKISDFGLAKLYEEENTHINTRIAGTMWATFLSFALYLLSFEFFLFSYSFLFHHLYRSWLWVHVNRYWLWSLVLCCWTE